MFCIYPMPQSECPEGCIEVPTAQQDETETLALTPMVSTSDLLFLLRELNGVSRDFKTTQFDICLKLSGAKDNVRYSEFLHILYSWWELGNVQQTISRPARQGGRSYVLEKVNLMTMNVCEMNQQIVDDAFTSLTKTFIRYDKDADGKLDMRSFHDFLEELSCGMSNILVDPRIDIDRTTDGRIYK